MSAARALATCRRRQSHALSSQTQHTFNTQRNLTPQIYLHTTTLQSQSLIDSTAAPTASSSFTPWSPPAPPPPGLARDLLEAPLRSIVVPLLRSQRMPSIVVPLLGALPGKVPGFALPMAAELEELVGGRGRSAGVPGYAVAGDDMDVPTVRIARGRDRLDCSTSFARLLEDLQKATELAHTVKSAHVKIEYLHTARERRMVLDALAEFLRAAGLTLEALRMDVVGQALGHQPLLEAFKGCSKLRKLEMCSPYETTSAEFKQLLSCFPELKHCRMPNLRIIECAQSDVTPGTGHRTLYLDARRAMQSVESFRRVVNKGGRHAFPFQVQITPSHFDSIAPPYFDRA